MLFFIILFVMTAPVIVLFATGYRFDSQAGIFVHSGSVTIKSWPRDVDIFLDGKKQDAKKLSNINNAYTINGVRPGHYSLRCEKEGYTGWEKDIDVHSGISTEFWNVILFPREFQTNTYSTGAIDQFFLSPRNNHEIVYFENRPDSRSVSLLDTENNESQEIFSTKEYAFLEKTKRENIEWSSDKKRIMIPLEDKNGQKQYVIARASKDALNEITYLDQVFSEIFPNAQPIFYKVRWMFDKNDEIVILTENHELYYLYLSDPNKSFVIDKNVSGFDFAGNRIYYSQLPNNLVWEIKDNDRSTKRQITNISASSGEDEFLELFAYDEYRVAIINKDKQLFVFNEEKEKGEKTMSEIGSPVESVQFSDDGKKLLYWTGNEIWNLMLRDWEVQPTRKKGDRFMITRFAQPIKNVQWMDNYENIIFSVGDTVKSVELDDRSEINMIDVAKTNKPIEEKNLIYDKENQVLYFQNEIDGNMRIQSELLIDKGGFLGF